MNNSRGDDDLMLAYGRGDSGAFEVLYERYRQPLYRYVFHAVGERAVAVSLPGYCPIHDARAVPRQGFKLGIF